MPASRDRSLLKTMNCRKGKWGQIAHWVFALYVAYLLLSSALVHLGNPYQFLSAIYAYRLLTRWAAELVATLLPFVHIALALCLIIGVVERQAFYIAFFLFLLYGAVQMIALSRGLNIACGCFGPSEIPNPIGAKSLGLVSSAILASYLGWRFPMTARDIR
jgi:hypothetical protein